MCLLLKAKYYPSGDLLDTAFIQQSQSWQGVLHGLELLKKGIYWMIGDGSKVKKFVTIGFLDTMHSRLKEEGPLTETVGV
jgi:hypothetical protein